jgi:parallel beta-helix repeat protein
VASVTLLAAIDACLGRCANERVRIALIFSAGILLSLFCPRASAATSEIVVTNNFVLAPGTNALRLIVHASHVTIDGQGSTLQGQGQTNDLKSMESAGIAILIEGASDVTVKNLRVRGFATGLLLRDCQAVSVSTCDFSDNYNNPAHGWGELPPRGGIFCERARYCVIRENQANRVWNALRMVDSDDNLVEKNDFSHCSNTAISLWHSSNNRFLENNLSYGIRIDRAAGEVHARDSTGVLIETGSDNNYWFRNDVTYGGDGIFIRPLNRWVSTGNVFVENDTSYANNNCVESWSPGNTFVRNIANHGSYGFWLGGSDHTILIGNEAAYNGLTNGNHNAPEPGFGHGGIVIVGGPSSHTLLDGNYVHANNGAGIAFRGDAGSQGRAWKTEHWVIQRNRIVSNRFGIWGRWGDAITLAGNQLTDNWRGNYLTNVSDLIELRNFSGSETTPLAGIVGPDFATVGERIRFDAAGSSDPSGAALNFHWWLQGGAGSNRVFERVFDREGYYRVGLTVDNGALADLAWRDLLVAKPVGHEFGTEGGAGHWGFELEGNDGKGRVTFEDDSQGIVGTRCLRFRPDPYPGQYVTAIYPAQRNAHWDLSGKKSIRFWIKVQNPNLPGFQNAGPVLRFLTGNGEIELKPVKDGNILNDPPFSEARWLWMPVSIPIAGDAQWARKVTGEPRLEQIEALSLSLDSWGWEPFTVWLDGLTVD